uniref:IGFBP N-terminal domain-containing protein n=1 Tax=Schistosoma mansoni TaxID=6183 RepID=A0A5K4EZV8_SCHMA
MSIQLFFLFFTHIIFIQIIHSSQYDNDDHHHYYEPSKSLQSPTILKQIEDECNKCDRKKCSPIIQCNVGIVRDKCGCCDICALEEAQLCNIPNDFINGILKQGITWYGICGTDLECRKRTDIDSKIIESQSICYCVKSGKVCGSDGITYSKCKMNATIISSNGTVIPISEGPCQTVPSVKLTVLNQTVIEGTNVTLICEARGYPIPTINWYFNKPNQKQDKIQMPGNYKDVTVSVRGGTEETHTISYLQITSFTLEYEGEYICMADNIVGIKAQGTSLVRNAASSIYSSSSS